MLTFREIEDDKKWDALVQNLPNYTFLNSSARYRYYKEAGIDAFRIAIYKENDFLGIITCMIGNSKLFGRFLECKHSPILIKSKEEYWKEVLKYCKKIAEENSCFMIRFAPLYTENHVLINFYKTNSFKLAPIHNVDALISQHIDLRKDIGELRREMNKTKRNLLNRLLKDESIRVEIVNNNSKFDLFKNLHKQTVKLKGYTDKPSSTILKELSYQIKNGMCYMLIGYYKERPIGIWQCTHYGDNIYLYHAATDTEFRDKNINITYLLFWESLKLGKDLGCKTLDLFGGVVPKGYENRKHPWSGIGAFKESLGGEKITYLHSRDYPMKRLKYIMYYIYSYIRTRLKGYTIDW